MSYSNIKEKGKVIYEIAEELYHEKNKKAAAGSFKLAADKCKNGDAASKYAKMLETGDGIEQNKEEAKKYYEKAADLGNEEATLKYVEMLDNGEVKEENLEKTAKYYYNAFCTKSNELEYLKKAADLGNEEALSKYVKKLCKGEVEETPEKTAEYLCKARHYKIQVFLTPEEKVIILKKLIDLKDYITDEKELAGIYHNYATLLYYERGIEQDKEEAAKYFKMAADLGSVRDIVKYAKMLETGEEIEKNEKEAKKYYEKAAELGDVYSKIKCFDDKINELKSELGTEQTATNPEKEVNKISSKSPLEEAKTKHKSNKFFHKHKSPEYNKNDLSNIFKVFGENLDKTFKLNENLLKKTIK